MSAALEPRVARIGQISVNAKDLDRAVGFYRDRLGLQHLFTVPKMAFFDCGGVRLMLGIAEKPEFDHPGSILYLETRDIEAVHATMAGEGVAFERHPHFVANLGDRDLWLAFFHDSEGNLLALMEEKRHPQATSRAVGPSQVVPESPPAPTSVSSCTPSKQASPPAPRSSSASPP